MFAFIMFVLSCIGILVIQSVYKKKLDDGARAQTGL
jgi:hypothetical protein